MMCDSFFDRYQRVWAETIDTYRQMISVEGWTGKAAIEVPAIQQLTFKVYSCLSD